MLGDSIKYHYKVCHLKNICLYFWLTLVCWLKHLKSKHAGQNPKICLPARITFQAHIFVCHSKSPKESASKNYPQLSHLIPYLHPPNSFLFQNSV